MWLGLCWLCEFEVGIYVGLGWWWWLRGAFFGVAFSKVKMWLVVICDLCRDGGIVTRNNY